MANITTLVAAGDSLTDQAGTSGIFHWFDLGVEVYPQWFSQLDSTGIRLCNNAAAGATAQVIQGEHGAPNTTSWRVNGFFGNQIFRTITFGPVSFDFGIGAALDDGTSNSAVIWIGQNDFSFLQNDAYDNIYDGTWTDGQVTQYLEDVRDGIFAGVDEYLAYGDGQLVVCVPASYNFSPYIQSNRPDPVKRERVEQAIGVELRALVLAGCQERRIACLDMHQLYDDLLGDHADPTETMLFGGNTINLQEGAAENPNFYGFQYEFEGEELRLVHPTTTIASIHLVAILMAFKIAYGHEYTKPSESTMCSWCTGLATGGADTRNLRYESYVRAFNLDTAGMVDAVGVFTPGVAAGGVFNPGVVAGQAA